MNYTELINNPAFSALDRRFAAFISRLSGSRDSRLVLAAAIVSRRLASGHTCLDLGRAACVEDNR